MWEVHSQTQLKTTYLCMFVAQKEVRPCFIIADDLSVGDYLNLNCVQLFFCLKLTVLLLRQISQLNYSVQEKRACFHSQQVSRSCTYRTLNHPTYVIWPPTSWLTKQAACLSRRAERTECGEHVTIFLCSAPHCIPPTAGLGPSLIGLSAGPNRNEQDAFCEL